MLLLLVAAAASSPCPLLSTGCTAHRSLVLAQGTSPCGCGFGLVRRVQTQDELKALTQVELDAFMREVDAELVENKGQADEMAEKHKKELKEMKETTEELLKQQTTMQDESKASFDKGHDEYAADAKKVKDLEQQVVDLSDRQASARADLSMVNGDLEFNLMNAQSCECDLETVFIKHSSNHSKVHHDNHTESKTGGHSKHVRKAALLSAPDFKKIYAIEKVETEIVDVMTKMQEEQAAYDKEVRLDGHARESAAISHKHKTTMAGKDSDLLTTRANAQQKAVEALEAMVKSKEELATAAEKRAADAKAKLEGLTAELQKCGCA